MLGNRGRTNRRTLGTTFIYIKRCASTYKTRKKTIGREHSRSAVIAALNKSLYEFDLKQERAGKTIPPGAQRIRGIAGSGKPFYLLKKQHICI